MADLVTYDDETNLPDVIATTITESPMTGYVRDHLTWMRDEIGLPLNGNVPGLLVYYLDDIDATKKEVKRMLKAFPRSEEMARCVRYDRSPMPRDFLDVFDRVNGRARTTRVGDNERYNPTS